MSHALSKSELSDKKFMLAHFREIAEESKSDIDNTFTKSQFKDKATESNKVIKEAREELIKYISESRGAENWTPTETLELILLTTYVSYIVMIEARNHFWEYEYMAFSRRIGELWEPFCKLIWEYGENVDVSLVNPPLFTDVVDRLRNEVITLISSLSISVENANNLTSYYENAWNLVTSGEIQLGLDLHFEAKDVTYNVDFKSGFSSNEKGNTNRLLLVASIYKMIDRLQVCEFYARSDEASNNHYIQTLKNSGTWNVYCGDEAYLRMEFHTGFDIKNWIRVNMNWESDFSPKTLESLNRNNLLDYLKW